MAQKSKKDIAADDSFRKNYASLHSALAQPNVTSGLASKLYAKAIITAETRDAIQITSGITPLDRAASLLQAVEKSIQIDYRRFRQFIRILRNNLTLKPTALRLHRCYRTLAGQLERCSSESDTDLEDTEQAPGIVQDTVASLTSMTFKFTKLSLGQKKVVYHTRDAERALPDQWKLDTETGQFTVAQQIEEFEARFRDLIDNAQDEIREKHTPVRKFRRTVMLLPLSIRADHYQFLTKNLLNIGKAESIDEIFMYLNLYWTFIDYDLLEHIISEHGSDCLKAKMEEYVQDIAQFKRTTTISQICGVAKRWHSRPDLPDHFAVLSTKFQKDPSEYTLAELERFRVSFCREFSLSESTAMFSGAIEGSVVILWHIPSSVVPALTAAICKHPNCSSFFERHSLLLLEIDGKCLYRSPANTGAFKEEVYEASHIPGLPAFLEVKLTPNQGNGIFTSKAIQPGVEIFTAKPYVFAIGGTTLAHVKSICSHCLKSTLPRPVECEECNAVGYCSKECMEAASQLHKLECKGLQELEKLRGKEGLDPPPPMPADQVNQVTKHWPPTVAVITARALNRKVLDGEKHWEIGYLAHSDDATVVEDATFVKPCVVPLVLECVATDDMISDAFCRICINYTGIGPVNSPHVSIHAVYATHSLLNHSCQPNCSYGSLNQTMSVYALTNIANQEQLCISYASRDTMLLYGSARRKELQKVFRFECTCPTCRSEAETGSDKWVLDRKKKSFIAPWKKETADRVMELGLKSLKEVESSTSIRDWVKVVKTSTTALSNQRRYLSETNIIRILTSLSLMNAHDNLGNTHEALRLAEAMLPYVRLYDSAEGIGAHLGRMSCYHFRINNKRKGLSLFWESLDIFPRNLNNEHYLTEALREASNMAMEEPSIALKLASKVRDMDSLGLTFYIH